MGYEFDGVNKIIQLTSGTTELDVKDMYSRWKEWMQNGGAKYYSAFSVVGGEPIDEVAGIYVTGYFFLTNGWRIRPQETGHKLKVFNGVLLTLEGEDPLIPTQGDYNVLVQYSQPIKSETIVAGGESVWNEEEKANLINSVSLVDSKIDGIDSIICDIKDSHWNKMVLTKINNNNYISELYDDSGKVVKRTHKLTKVNDVIQTREPI